MIRVQKNALCGSLLAVAFLLAASCTHRTPLDFSVKKVEQDVPLVEGAAEPHCQLNIQVALADGDTPNALSINRQIVGRLFGIEMENPTAAIDSFARGYAANYRAMLQPFYQADSGAHTVAWYNYTYTLVTATENGRGDALCYTAHRSYQEGGAHTVDETICLNFDRATGALLTLDSLFSDGYIDELKSLLQQKLLDETGCATLGELQEKGYLQTTDMYVPENYQMLSGKVRFIFNPYEIAAYDKGAVELTLSDKTLKQILKKD